VTTEIAREASRLTKEEWREYTKTVWHIANVSHGAHPAVFPAEIPHRLVKLFSFVGETVLDPFAGVGTTAAAATLLDRHAVSVELNPNYAKLISESVLSNLSQVHVADSRDLGFLDAESVDLAVTSPPYWNKANYGGDSANLGNVGSYPQFFEEMGVVFSEVFRVLRPGRKACIVTANVNQHTDHGLLTFPLAADFTVLLRDIGFVLINELVWSKDRTGGRWGSAGIQRPIFGSYPYPPNFLFKNVHEYILIFAKPPARATTGPKVLSYRSLMAHTSPSNPRSPGGNGSSSSHSPKGGGHSKNGKDRLPRR
jgi:site-specific DNA-methyltransferase (adenine-specific)